MKTIEEIQNIIKENDCAEYYHEYSRHEANYWGEIPEWILECNNVNEVLDIGIAYSSLALYTGLNHHANITGIDNRKYISDKLINAYDIDYITANIELDNLEELNNKFNIIIMTEVVEHLNFNPIPTLTKIKNMMKEDGVLFLSSPNSACWGRLAYYKDWKEIPYPDRNKQIKDEHIFQYSKPEIEELFNAVGLKVEKYAESGDYPYVHMNFKLTKV